MGSKVSVLSCKWLRLRFSTHSGLTFGTSSSTNHDRYQPCSYLANRDIPHAVWLEDILARYGGNTLLWDLHLLVPNPELAAVCLRRFGYIPMPSYRLLEEPEFGLRVARPSSQLVGDGVVLISAADWHYDLSFSTSPHGACHRDGLPPIPLPYLHHFLDSLMAMWLGISSRDYVNRLSFALSIGSLIIYCYELEDPDCDEGCEAGNGLRVRTNDYAKYLRKEHHELHYDIVAASGRDESFTTTQRHAYHVRRMREIIAGEFVPKPYDKDAAYRPSLTALAE